MFFKYLKSTTTTKATKYYYYSTSTNDLFKPNEIVIAFIRNSIYHKKSIDSQRLLQLNENSIFKTKYFDIMHKHIINRNVNKCNFIIKPNKNNNDFISITIKRPSLYEYISNIPHVAVPSQYSILAFVPFLLEIDKNKKILESGTGNGSMTLFLSQYLDSKQGGLIHTFDIKSQTKSKFIFNNWKNSYDLRFNNDNFDNKWFNNVEFFSSDVIKHEFDNEKFNEFYDIIYLDLSRAHLAIKRLLKLLKINGIILINCMHLTQIIYCINMIDKEKLNLITEIIIEPSTRLWEIEKFQSRKEKFDYKDYFDNIDYSFDYLCRIEDPNASNYKRDGLYSSHWPGF